MRGGRGRQHALVHVQMRLHGVCLCACVCFVYVSCVRGHTGRVKQRTVIQPKMTAEYPTASCSEYLKVRDTPRSERTV